MNYEIQTKLDGVNLTRLRDCVLKNKTSPICLTVWGSYIPKFEENLRYEITNLVIKNYYGIKLLTTPTTITEKKEIDVELDWSDIDVKEYLNNDNQTVNSSIRVLKM